MASCQARGEVAGKLDFGFIQRRCENVETILECLPVFFKFVMNTCDALATRRLRALPVKPERGVRVAEPFELARDLETQALAATMCGRLGCDIAGDQVVDFVQQCRVAILAEPEARLELV